MNELNAWKDAAEKLATELYRLQRTCRDEINHAEEDEDPGLCAYGVEDSVHKVLIEYEKFKETKNETT